MRHDHVTPCAATFPTPPSDSRREVRAQVRRRRADEQRALVELVRPLDCGYLVENRHTRAQVVTGQVARGDPAAAYGLTLPDLPDELEQMCERPQYLSVALLSGTDAPVRPHTTLDGATDNSPRPDADGTRSTARRSACRRRRRRRAARCRAGRNRSPTVCGTWSGCHSGAAGRRWLHSRRMHTDTPPAPRRCPGTSPTSRWERDSSDDRYP